MNCSSSCTAPTTDCSCSTADANKRLIEPKIAELWITSTQKLPSVGKALATLKSGEVLVLLRSGSTLIYNPAAMANPLRPFTYNLEINATCVAVCPMTGIIWIGAQNKMCSYKMVDGELLGSFNTAFNPGAITVATNGDLIVWNSDNGEVMKLVDVDASGNSLVQSMTFKCVNNKPMDVLKMNVNDGLLYVVGHTRDVAFINCVRVWDVSNGLYMGHVLEGATSMTFNARGCAVVVKALEKYREKAIDDVACCPTEGDLSFKGTS